MFLDLRGPLPPGKGIDGPELADVLLLDVAAAPRPTMHRGQPAPDGCM
ncbi:hypothetical protein WME97_12835 [Sorangium sp. So ce367]